MAKNGRQYPGCRYAECTQLSCRKTQGQAAREHGQHQQALQVVFESSAPVGLATAPRDTPGSLPKARDQGVALGSSPSIIVQPRHVVRTQVDPERAAHWAVRHERQIEARAQDIDQAELSGGWVSALALPPPPPPRTAHLSSWRCVPVGTLRSNFVAGPQSKRSKTK